jgi:hypothetical protein
MDIAIFHCMLSLASRWDEVGGRATTTISNFLSYSLRIPLVVHHLCVIPLSLRKHVWLHACWYGLANTLFTNLNPYELVGLRVKNQGGTKRRPRLVTIFLVFDGLGKYEPDGAILGAGRTSIRHHEVITIAGKHNIDRALGSSCTRSRSQASAGS